ncbi:RecName: Full Flavonol synthase/flavanone 3-hydroxylase AltName: Full CitFLS Short FLS [Tripterygium wilfordii]|uniref:Fe2OG dioxygenase domain-containing protein n=1 Tax=Tripterygium wilfordii TaxID=458696 RepID=A0A7J7DFQ7_TRIWF|nr:flavonol synthase/flavanone 3-hydroxylase-like [Tripterygium wilfordii]KAF5745094.1 RecName: Full Flavonol synthase/flavanone 3-hydroxylase AltName: Full CitFLS Short FLS [Tripterygium wilfordii]
MEVERVQAIAYLSIAKDTIPADFIRPENEQPAITTFHGPLPEIPTIDLNDPDQEKVVRLISDASRDWGIFQVVNHGIPSDLISKLQCVGKEFFELPQEEKEKYARPNDAKDIEGYGNKLQKGNGDAKKAWVDHLFHRVWPPSRINYQFWPQTPPSYREVNEEYAKQTREVADKLFKSLSLGLGVEGNVLKEALGGEELEYMMKINYYPPCPRPDLALGVVAHTDLSCITILVPNEVPGLQVFKDDHWIDAKYIPNALIIHIGDQIEILSNGKYKAVLHRTTVDKDRTRMSWPVFLEPPADLVVGPLPQLVTQDNSPKYKAKKFKDYAYCKLNKLPQ